jgi:hypothetical protein
MNKKKTIPQLIAVQVAAEGPRTAFEEPVYAYITMDNLAELGEVVSKVVNRKVRITRPQAMDTSAVERSSGHYFGHTKPYSHV